MPPGPPAQPYNAGPPPLDVGTAIGYGWKKFQEHAKEFVLLTLAAFLVIIFWQFVSSFIQNNLPANLFGTLLALGIRVVGFVISMLVQAGIWRAGLAVTRGETPNVNMLTQTDNLGPYVLTSIVVGIGTFIGIILCVIPGIIWLVLTAFAPLVALDKGVGPGEAISTSIDWVKNNAGRVILVLVVAYVVYVLGIVACCVGLLVSMPVALVAITYSYRILGNEPVAP